MDYAFLVSSNETITNAGVIQAKLLAITPKVRAITMATHTVPWTVFVHCFEELSDDERSLIQATLSGN